MASPKTASPRVQNPRSRSPDDGEPSPRASSPIFSQGSRRSVSFKDDHRRPRSRDSEDDHATRSSPAPQPTQIDVPSPPTSSNSSQDLKQPWYRRLGHSFQSISLENKGSVARDHLALERTFLAWLRTSLAFSSIGIAITQLFRLNTSLAEEKRQVASQDEDLRRLFDRTDGANSLPLSPLMGASLSPETYTSIQNALRLHFAQKQRPPQYDPASATLLDLLVRTAEFDSGAALRLRRLGKPLGATFLGISIVILLIGFRRYFESQHWIIRGQFPASRGSVALTGFIAAMLIIVSLVIVVVIVPGAYNK